MYMFKQLNFDLKAARRDSAPAVVQSSLSPCTKKGTDRDGRRPFLLVAIKLSAYLLT